MSNTKPQLLPYGLGYLLTETAQWIHDRSPYPNFDYAAAGALAFYAGIVGRGWTVSGAGLNQYFIVVGSTGSGKEAIDQGIQSLITQLDAPSYRNGLASNHVGPSEAASMQGYVRYLEKKRCFLSRRGEIGFVIEQTGNPKAPPHIRGLERQELQLYSASGIGGSIQPIAYSDRDKNTATIERPAVSWIGETTPESFNANMTVGKIASGWVPRTSVFESLAQRPNLNENPITVAPHTLLAPICDLMAQAANLDDKPPQAVAMTQEARDCFRNFERFSTEQIRSREEVVKQLYNRAHLKAMKFAAVSAVTRNMFLPEIDLSEALWACNLVAHQTDHLIGKFERNEVGSVDGDEAKQRAAVLRIIAEYLNRDFASLAKYDVVEEMHKRGVITHSYLSRRLFTLPAFKDRLGPTAAIKRVVQRMLEDDELREMPAKQMVETFGSKPKAYVMSNMKPFLSAL